MAGATIHFLMSHFCEGFHQEGGGVIRLAATADLDLGQYLVHEGVYHRGVRVHNGWQEQMVTWFMSQSLRVSTRV